MNIILKCGCLSGIGRGDVVSVYADLEGKCRRGLTKPYDGQKVFVGNGVAVLDRKDIFCSQQNVRHVCMTVKTCFIYMYAVLELAFVGQLGVLIHTLYDYCSLNLRLLTVPFNVQKNKQTNKTNKQVWHSVEQSRFKCQSYCLFRSLVESYIGSYRIF